MNTEFASSIKQNTN